ncbi:response regulator [Dokdonia ponticola]|uniref:Response regulator n=1 Tax=Dokdonia ponticola TaxID=2041041 RepID=A0ABV9HWJ1_9FLAO
MKRKILLVEDEAIVRDAYVSVFKDIEQSGTYTFSIHQCSSCQEAFYVLKEQKQVFDLVFLDVRIPPDPHNGWTSGIDIGRYIRENNTKTQILMISSVVNQDVYQEVLNDVYPELYLLKYELTTAVLKETVEKILHKDFVLKTNEKNHYGLNTDILELLDIDIIDLKLLNELSLGATTKELEKIIHVSKRTIEYRKKALKEKLDVSNGSTRDLIVKAKELKLIS